MQNRISNNYANTEWAETQNFLINLKFKSAAAPYIYIYIILHPHFYFFQHYGTSVICTMTWVIFPVLCLKRHCLLLCIKEYVAVSDRINVYVNCIICQTHIYSQTASNSCAFSGCDEVWYRKYCSAD